MSRRSLINDEKLLSDMISENISSAADLNIDMSDILNIEQMELMATYKEMYNYDSYLSFFLSLALMSHCSQGSFYTHYLNSDQQPLNLYFWLLGPSGKLNSYVVKI